MKRLALILGASLFAVSVAAVTFALTVSGPINPSDTAAAIQVGAQLATALAGHQYQPAVAFALMLLVWIGHQPWAGAFLDKLGKAHNPVLLLGGGLLSALTDKLLSGGTFGVSMIVGALTPLLATGFWEHLTDWLPGKKSADPAAPVGQ